ncbi:MAG: motility associated factor glycosyltransferase family protein [Bacillota bacterium]
MIDGLLDRAKDPHTREVLLNVKKLGDSYLGEKFRETMKGRQFGSLVDPGLEAEVWAEDFYEEDKDVFILVGTGRLHYHKKLTARLGKKQRLFVLDWKLPLIWHALHNEKEEDLTGAQWYFYPGKDQLFLRIASLLDENLTARIKFGFVPPYKVFFRNETNEIEDRMRELIALNLVRTRTIDLFGAQWINNNLINTGKTFERGVPFRELAGKFRDIPAIVVSAGPSLEKNIEQLNDLKDRAVIICSGSAVETMNEYGIRPHLLASFDGGEGNYPHFAKLDTGDLRLVYTLDVYPRIVDEFKGALIPVEGGGKNSYKYLKNMGAPDLGEALIGPSVANFSLDIAVKLGCNPIILIGQDLSFSGGKSHARGNFYRVENEDYKNELRVKGNVEEFVYTTKSWYAMLKNFEKQITLYRDKKIINATEGGAYIQGTELSTLRSAAEKHLGREYPIDEMIDQSLNNPIRDVDRDDLLSKTERDINLWKDEIRGILKKVSGLIVSLEKNPSVNGNRKKTIDKIKKFEDKLIESDLYSHLIKSLIHGRILYFERFYRRQATLDPFKVELWVVKYQRELFRNSLLALEEISKYIGGLRAKEC